MKKVIIGLAAFLVGITSVEAQVSDVDVSHSADVSATSIDVAFAKKPRKFARNRVCRVTYDLTLGYQGSTTAVASSTITKRYTANTRRSKTFSCDINGGHGVGVGPSDALPVLSVFVTTNNRCFGGVSSESSGSDAAFAACTSNSLEQTNTVFLNRIKSGLNKCFKALED